MPKQDKNNELKMTYYAKKIQDMQKHIHDKATFDTWSIFELRERSDVLKSTYNKHEAKCMTKQNEKDMNETELEKFQDECNEIDELYIKVKAQIEQRIEYLTQNPNAQAMQSNNEHKSAQKSQNAQTREVVQQFTGSLNDWFKFQDEMQQKVVNNANMTDEMKMIELIQVCTPQLLEALQTVGFENSWNKLVSTYDDKYKLSQFYIRKLLNIQQIDCPSNENITQMLNEIKSIEKAFEKIENVTTESIMIYAIVSKLDKETGRAWKRFKNVLAVSWASANEGKQPHEHMPNLESLYKFLEEERDIYMSELVDAQSFAEQCKIVEPSDAPTTSANAVTNACNFDASSSKMKSSKEAIRTDCILCPPQTFHPLYRCTKFLAMEIVDRVKIISEHRLCIRCFRTEHLNPCTDARSNLPCNRCKPQIVYHNSTLCDRNIFKVPPMVKPTVVTSSHDDEDWSN